jgi:hypothetical protein
VIGKPKAVSSALTCGRATPQPAAHPLEKLREVLGAHASLPAEAVYTPRHVRLDEVSPSEWIARKHGAQDGARQ